MGELYSRAEKARIRLKVDLGDGQGKIEHPVWIEENINWPVVDLFLKQNEGKMSDIKLGSLLRISRPAITQRRKHLKLAPLHIAKYDWDAIDPFITHMSVRLAAEMFDVPKSVIHRRIQKLRKQQEEK